MGRSTDQSPGGVLAVAIVPTVLCIIVVALRFYTRRYQQKVSYGWDDWLTLPALVKRLPLHYCFHSSFLIPLLVFDYRNGSHLYHW